MYCFSPAGWLYQKKKYLGLDPPLTNRLVSQFLGNPLRRWDRKAAASCDQYLAISSAVRDRIRRTYGRESVDDRRPILELLGPPKSDSKGESVAGGRAVRACVSRLLPYKNVDQVIEALQKIGLRLIVVGKVPEEGRLRARAADGVLMLSDLSEEEIRSLYLRCELLVRQAGRTTDSLPSRRFIRQASVVLRWGGFLDTVTENETGVVL